MNINVLLFQVHHIASRACQFCVSGNQYFNERTNIYKPFTSLFSKLIGGQQKVTVLFFFNKIAWSADSRLICSGSADSTLKVSVSCLIFLLLYFYLTFLKWLLIEICVTFHG